VYRLSIGALPFITGIFPLGGTRRTEAKIRLYGVNLPQESITLKLDKSSPAVIGVKVTDQNISSNIVPFAVDEIPETAENDANDTPEGATVLQPPVIVNGRIDRPGDVDYFKFHGKAKEVVVVDVRARRLDSPLDSVVTIFNAQGRQLAENDDTVDKSEGLITHHADSHIEYRLPAEGDYTIKLRDVQAKGAITLKLDGAPKGVTLKRAVIGADADRVAAAITVSKQIRAGSKFNIVLAGTMKLGKETITCVAPAVGVSVVAPPKK